MYVVCPNVKSDKPDVLATVDIDPESPTYCQVRISKKQFISLINKLHVKNDYFFHCAIVFLLVEQLINVN